MGGVGFCKEDPYDSKGMLVNEGSLPNEFEGFFAVPENLKISVSAGDSKTGYALEIRSDSIR